MKAQLVALLVFVSLSTVLPMPLDTREEGIQLDDNCVDKGTNCRNWALNGFCVNCYYTCQQRRDYCARTCGFCHPGYVCTNCTSTTTTKASKVNREQDFIVSELINL